MNKIFSNLIKSVILIASLSQVANAGLLTSFNWTATCVDCATEIGITAESADLYENVTGNIVIRDYVEGEDFIFTNDSIVSTTYIGSDHVDPFAWTSFYDVTGSASADLSEIYLNFKHDEEVDLFTIIDNVVLTDELGNIIYTPGVMTFNVFFEKDIYWGIDIAINGIPAVSSPGAEALYRDAVLAEPVTYDFGFGASFSIVDEQPTDVPEPSTLAIFALGIMGLASRKFKKNT